MRILLVEDDDAFASALCDALGGIGHRTTRVSSGHELFAKLKANERPDLVLLDLGLPDADGLALCARVRRLFSIPVIVVTARGDLSSRVQGLRGGADDYVVKPFALAELLARMEAVMRRAPAVAAAPVRIGDVMIDAAARVVEVGGKPVGLSRKEFDLLAALARAPGTTVHRDRLLLEVWHSDYGALSRTLDVHIATLRAKLDRPKFIETVRGVGYRLAVPDSSS